MAYQVVLEDTGLATGIIHRFSGDKSPLPAEVSLTKENIVFEMVEDEAKTASRCGKVINIVLSTIFEEHMGPNKHHIPTNVKLKKTHKWIQEAESIKTEKEQKEATAAAALVSDDTNAMGAMDKGEKKRKMDRVALLEVARAKSMVNKKRPKTIKLS
eukprot:2454710-Heterocapsa_arctica.AAC.1